MRSLIIITSLFFYSFGPLIAQVDVLTTELDQILQKDVADGQFCGGTAAILVGDKEVVAVAGYRNMEAKIPFERGTLNRIASIAKSMTAVAALQLYEQGKLDLDLPIETYLPNYPKRHASRITTRQLLLHSSGIGEYKSSKETESTIQYNSLAEAATVFQDRDLVAQPGNAEHYTSYGYVVLGMVIEVVSGQSYEAYMKENIWAPAGMDQTGVERYDQIYENKSALYHRKKRGKIRLSKTNNLSNRIPGGGIYSTVDDLLKFGKAIINHTLIKETTFEMMTAEPGLAYDGNPYGMGWFIYGENPELGEVFGHTGGQTGCTSLLLIAPEKDAVMVVMNNTALTMSHTFGIAIKHLFPMVKQLSEQD